MPSAPSGTRRRSPRGVGARASAAYFPGRVGDSLLGCAVVGSAVRIRWLWPRRRSGRTGRCGWCGRVGQGGGRGHSVRPVMRSIRARPRRGRGNAPWRQARTAPRTPFLNGVHGPGLSGAPRCGCGCGRQPVPHCEQLRGGPLSAALYSLGHHPGGVSIGPLLRPVCVSTGPWTKHGSAVDTGFCRRSLKGCRR